MDRYPIQYWWRMGGGAAGLYGEGFGGRLCWVGVCLAVFIFYRSYLCHTGIITSFHLLKPTRI